MSLSITSWILIKVLFFLPKPNHMQGPVCDSEPKAAVQDDKSNSVFCPLLKSAHTDIVLCVVFKNTNN